MTINNRVVWSEGLFLRPQHFHITSRGLQALHPLDKIIGILHPLICVLICILIQNPVHRPVRGLENHFSRDDLALQG